MSNCVKEAEGSPDETSFTAKYERGTRDWGLKPQAASEGGNKASRREV
ncbi:MAG: hypothetical protein V7K94_08700 [Nostoc sp.]